MKRTKNATTAHAHESNKRRFKRLLREMAWNDWSMPLKGAMNGRETTPARRRIIE
jgi:hypothetical protein